MDATEADLFFGGQAIKDGYNLTFQAPNVPTSTPTPDIPATLTAQIAALQAQQQTPVVPTLEPPPTPDIEATIDARVNEMATALAESQPTPEPTETQETSETEDDGGGIRGPGVGLLVVLAVILVLSGAYVLIKNQSH